MIVGYSPGAVPECPTANDMSGILVAGLVLNSWEATAGFWAAWCERSPISSGKPMPLVRLSRPRAVEADAVRRLLKPGCSGTLPDASYGEEWNTPTSGLEPTLPASTLSHYSF